MVDKKIMLTESEIPTHWYNVMADMPNPIQPPINPATGKPAGPDDFAAIFPKSLIAQEMSQERLIEIPEEVRELYKIWRPTPLVRAVQLEKALDTPAHIYYKYEGVSPAGSHKLNTAIPQVYYNKMEGIKRIATETGAGQWGSSVSMACKFFGLECTVYMVKVSYSQKPYRRILMNTFGAEVIASPSDRTESGKAVLAQNPDSLGSLGIAISEAVEDAAKRS
ncbi:MAG TPA: TrpB-like pyridoxal phosphate-dependent enzyme, partial [Bacilli bacterium]